MTLQPSFLTRTLIAGACALGLAACGGGGDDGPAPTKSVTITFGAINGATAVSGCGTPLTGLGSGAVAAKLKDLRFYVSDVRLVRADGSEALLDLGADSAWTYSSVNDRLTLIDLEDATGDCATSGTAAMNATVTGTVPAGDYVGIKATLGVPFAFNHSDYAAAPAPLNLQAMAWSWQSGRKHAKVEVSDPAGATGTWTAKTFNFHLGSTGCTGNPASGQTVSCSAPNRMAFGFTAFDPATQKIVLDLNALLGGQDITVNRAGAAGCMSGGTDPECLTVFDALQIDWKADGTGTGQPINGGATQTLFKVAAK